MCVSHLLLGGLSKSPVSKYRMGGGIPYSWHIEETQIFGKIRDQQKNRVWRNEFNFYIPMPSY
jgi:hypothetical protein